MEGDIQKFLLLKDCSGSITNTSLMGAFKNTVTRSYSFQATKGMLFKLKAAGHPRIVDTVDVISCANNSYCIEACPVKYLRSLSHEEFELLRAIPSYHDRVEVCNPAHYGGKSKLQQGLEVQKGTVVEVCNLTGDSKLGTGFIKSIGPMTGIRNKAGTYFSVVLSRNSNHSDPREQDEVIHLHLNRLDFTLEETKLSADHQLNMTGKLQKFLLLEDCQGIVKSRSHSFHAVKGMLFEVEPGGRVEVDMVDMISCLNSDQYIKNCPFKVLRPLKEEEFNILLAIPSYEDRMAVSNSVSEGCKCKLQLGLEAKEEDVVEVYNMTCEIKIGIGFIKSIGPISDRNKKGTYFGVMVSDETYHPDASKQPKISHFPLHRLDFLSGKKKEDTKEVIDGCLKMNSVDDSELNALVRQQKEMVQKREEKKYVNTDSKRLPAAPNHQIPKEVAALCECPVCFNLFHNPKSLQCEHHFCKDCLGELVKFDEYEVPFIRCPTCNSIHLFEDKHAKLESLKCHLFVKQILDSYCRSIRVDDGPRCCNQPVHWYCGDCRQYMCDKCYEALDAKTCQNTTSVRYCRSKESVLPYCTVHEMLQYQGCATCSNAVCPYCVEKHKGHSVLSLVEYAGNMNGYLTNLIDLTKEQSSKVDRFLHDESGGAKKAIITKAKNLVFMVRSVESKLLEKAEILEKKECSRLEEKLKKNREILEKAEVVQKQGNVGIIWGTPKLIGTTPVCAGTPLLSEIGAEIADGDLYGIDCEQALMTSMCNYFQDLTYLGVDEAGNTIERKIDLTAADFV